MSGVGGWWVTWTRNRNPASRSAGATTAYCSIAGPAIGPSRIFGSKRLNRGREMALARCPLDSTLPRSHARRASVRVLKNRAAHSHLSILTPVIISYNIRDEEPTSVGSLPVAGTWAGSPADHRSKRLRQRHDNVLAYDGRV